MAKQDLTVKVEAKGAKQTAQDLKSVDKAQQDLSKGAEGVAKGADKVAEAQEDLNVNTEAYATILSNVSPRMTALTGGMKAAWDIIGSMGAASIGLAARLRKLTTAIRGSAAALKLLGAAGTLAFGIWAIVAAVRAMGVAFDKATEAAKKLIDELRRQKEEFSEQQKAIRAVADARREFAAITPREAERATKRARAAIARGVDPATAIAVAGEAAGLGLTAEQEARYGLQRQTGRAGQLDPRMSPRQRRQAIAAAERRSAEWTDQRMAAEREIRQRQRQAAQHEARQVEGSTANLRAELRIQFPALSDEEIAQMAQRVQQQGGNLETFRAARRSAWQLNPWAGWEGTRKIPTIRGRREEMTAVEQVELERALEGLQSGGGGEQIGGTVPAIRGSGIGPPPRRRLPGTDAAFEAATRGLGGTVDTGAGNITINNHFDQSQTTYPDHASQEAARTNGETAMGGAW